jgi:hypothetical protein
MRSSGDSKGNKQNGAARRRFRQTQLWSVPEMYLSSGTLVKRKILLAGKII